MKKTVLLLTATFLFSVGLVAFLFFYTTQKSFLNNFVRKIRPHALGPTKLLDLRYANFYFAGTSDKKIYLGNANSPLHVFASDPQLTDTLLMKMSPMHDSLKLLMARVGIAHNMLYLFDGGTPAIYQSLPKKGAVLRSHTHNKIFFTDAVPIGPKTFALRIYDRISRQYMLAREVLTDSISLTPAPGILQKQVDGIFCTDGSLLYDSTASRLLYIYRYRNEFICMDTSMNILYRANTIDTTTHARIEVDTIRSDGSITLKSPPAVVNRMACMDSQWLFVNSNLMADNEDRRAADQAVTIDVYRLEDGKYQFSFYLPDLGGERMYNFGAAHGNLYVLYGHNLVRYTLDPGHFRKRESGDPKATKKLTQ